MVKYAIGFIVGTMVLLSVVFGLHLFVNQSLGVAIPVSALVLSYAVNWLMAVLRFGFLAVFRKRFHSQLGFLFMAGSLFKFLVIFQLFYLDYHADGVVTRAEFATFFIPYALALTLEIFAVSKMISKEH